MVASDTMNIAKRFTSIFAVVAVSALLGAAVPAASAGGAMADTTVTATRSFPKTTAAKRDFLAEHTSTDVESNADWGGIESLDVPQTESQAEKDQKAQEQAEAEAQAQAAQLKHRRPKLRHRLNLRLPVVLPIVLPSAFLRLPRVPLGRLWPTTLCSSKAILTWPEAILRPAGIALVSYSGCSPSSG